MISSTAYYKDWQGCHQDKVENELDFNAFKKAQKTFHPDAVFNHFLKHPYIKKIRRCPKTFFC